MEAPVPAEFNENGIRLQYPENWTDEGTNRRRLDRHDPEPETAFLLLTRAKIALSLKFRGDCPGGPA